MNASVYLFGQFNSGYSQYPFDNASSDVFKKCYAHSKSTTQLAIHRDRDLMYYGYIRKLGENRYIGLCVTLNGAYINHINALFTLFEDSISRLVEKGHLIRFDEQGEIVANVDQLHIKKEEVELLAGSLRSGINKYELYAKALPPVNYGVSRDSVKEFEITDSDTDIVSSSYTYGYTFVYKDRDYNTSNIDSFQHILRQVNEKNQTLTKRCDELQKENERIRREKKQISNVVRLVLILIGCCIGIFFLYRNLSNTQVKLDAANGEIEEKDATIREKGSRIDSLEMTNDSLQREWGAEIKERQSAEARLKRVCDAYPLIVTSLTVSCDSLSFDYEAVEEKEIFVTLKAVNDKKSEVVSNNHTLTVHKGGGRAELKFNSRLDLSDFYYVMLLYDGKIIAGKYW